MKTALTAFALIPMLVGSSAVGAPSPVRQTNAAMSFCEAYSRAGHGMGSDVIASGEIIGAQPHGYVISSPDCDAGPQLNWVGPKDDPEWKRVVAALDAAYWSPTDIQITGEFFGILYENYGGIVIDARKIAHLEIGKKPPALTPNEVAFDLAPSFAFAPKDARKVSMTCEIRSDGRLRLCWPSLWEGRALEHGWERASDALEKARVAKSAKDGSATRGRTFSMMVPLTDDRKIYGY